MGAYLYIKAFHIIFMVSWFAGLFYIFRLFVYHVKFQSEENMRQAYSLMERKLLYIIMHPAMLLTILTGIALVVINHHVLTAPWFHVKMSLVLFLIAYQIFASITHKRFSRGDFFLSEKKCRMINEIPTLILIGAVIMAVVKPI